MKFAYRLIEDFPPLAWVAIRQPDPEIVSVLHGRFVETRPDCFVEGAWAGDFTSGMLHDADTVFGSGGVLGGDAATFVSSTATTDFLFHSDDARRFVISNSLPLLLATTDDALEPACPEYSRINASILGGIHHYVSSIPTRRGQVRRVMHHNVRLGPSDIALIEKPAAPGFDTFIEYRNFLRLRIAQLFGNARHETRRLPLQIWSTQSRGYDSTAVNALAAPFGVDRVFTSPESKDAQSFYLGRSSNGPSDDGTAVCETLRLPCTQIDRRSFENRPLRFEHYYWAGLDANQDFNLSEIMDHASAPTLLLTGQYGEFWYPSGSIRKDRQQFLDDGLTKWDLAGHGLAEVRLKTGVIQAAIPVIGSRHRASILRITESEEMSPWRLGTRYDRPIPRRIAEEAGVPREMFGQVKLASVVDFPSPKTPLAPELRREFLRHLREHGLLGRGGAMLLPLVRRLNNWIYWSSPGLSNRHQHPLLWRAGYYWTRIAGRSPRLREMWTRLDAYLYAFCVNRVRAEYIEQVRQGGTARS